MLQEAHDEPEDAGGGSWCAKVRGKGTLFRRHTEHGDQVLEAHVIEIVKHDILHLTVGVCSGVCFLVIACIEGILGVVWIRVSIFLEMRVLSLFLNECSVFISVQNDKWFFHMLVNEDQVTKRQLFVRLVLGCKLI